MHKKLFIFDFDGTICNTLGAISGSLQATFTEYSDDVPGQAEIAQLIGSGKTLQETIQTLRSADQKPLQDQELRQWIEHYRQHYARYGESLVTLFPGAQQTLQHLRTAGDLVLLSNKGRLAVHASLQRFGIHEHFAFVLAEEPGQPVKPDADVFSKRILPLFPAANPADCIVIGDTATDLTFASNIGATSCYASYGFGDAALCNQIGYTHALASLSDLVGLFA